MGVLLLLLFSSESGEEVGKRKMNFGVLFLSGGKRRARKEEEKEDAEINARERKNENENWSEAYSS